MFTSNSRRGKHGLLAWILPLGCTAEPLDAPALDTDGPAASTGDTGKDVAITSSTDDGGSSSETSGGSGTTGPSDPGPPEPEAPDDSCLDDLPAPEEDDEVWIAAGYGGVVLRSTDGAHWDPIEVGGLGGLRESASVGSTFVLAAPYVDELQVSDDGGLTWDLLASGLPTSLHDLEGVGDLFLARDEAGETSYWSADGRIWHEAQGVAPKPVYAVGPAGILSGTKPVLRVALSVDGTVWSELLPTTGDWWGNNLNLAGRQDQYLAWPREYPPNRIHSSVDGLTWTTSDIALSDLPYPTGDTLAVRWNGAQYVLLGHTTEIGSARLIARSCNGRVWGHIHIPCWSGADYICTISDFASTPAMTVIIVSSLDWTTMVGYATIEFSPDLVDWSIAGTWDHPLLSTVVVGDP